MSFSRGEAVDKCHELFLAGAYSSCIERALPLVEELPSSDLLQLALISLQRLHLYDDARAFGESCLQLTAGNELDHALIELTLGASGYDSVVACAADESAKAQIDYYAGARALTIGQYADAVSAFDRCLDRRVHCRATDCATAERQIAVMSKNRRQTLQQWQRFVRRDSHILTQDPSLLFQQSANQPTGTAPAQIADRRSRSKREVRPWLRWVNKPKDDRALPCLVLSGHQSSVYACAVSHDGHRVASAGWDGVRIWDFESGEQLQGDPVIPVRSGAVWFTPGRLVISEWSGSNQFGAIKVYEDHSWRLLETWMPVEVRGSAAVSSNGRCILVSNGDRITLHDFDSHAVLHELPGEDGHRLCSVSFDSSGDVAIVTKRVGEIAAWDVNSGTKQFSFSTTAVDLRAGIVSRDGKMIALVRPDGVLCYEFPTPRLVAVVRGHSSGIEGCCFSPDGKWILTCGRDAVIRVSPVPVSEAEEPKLPPQFLEFTSKQMGFQVSKYGQPMVTACAFDDDGSQIALIDTTEGGKLFDGKTLEPLRPISGLTTSGRDSIRGYVHTACVFSAGGAALVSGNKRGELSGYLLFAEAKPRRFPSPHAYAITDLAFSGERGVLLSVSEDRRFKLWTTTGELLAAHRAHDATIHACSLSPLGSYFATASEDGTVKVWSASDGSQTAVFRHESPVTCVAFSPNGASLASGTADGELNLWDVERGLELARFSVCDESARRCWWTPDGRQLIVASQSASVIIVNAGTGETTARFVSRAALMAASVEPEGRRIVITTRTGDVVLLCLENLEFDRREFLKLHARGVKRA